MWSPGKEMMKSYEKNKSQLNKRNSLKDNLDFSRTVSKPLKFKEVSKDEREVITKEFII